MEFKSVNKILERAFRENWEREALSNYEGETLCYKNLAEKIAKLHICFGKCKVKKGDKIAICGKNSSNWGVAFLASLTYGAVPVPLLHEFKPENIHYLVTHCEAKFFFVDGSIYENLNESEMPDVEVFISLSTMEPILVRKKSFAEAISNLPAYFEKKYPQGFTASDIIYHEDKAKDLALINYTSGTSGFSKGVMLSYKSVYVNLVAAGHTAEPHMDKNSNSVAMLPSAHMYGMMFEFLFEVSIGAHVHFLTRTPSPKVILKAFQEIHPDVIVVVPLILEKVYKNMIKPVVESNKMFLKLPIIDKIIEKKICDGMISAFGTRFAEVVVGGAAFNPEVEAFLHKVKFPFTVGYGMTECGPLITYVHWDQAKVGSCGKPVPGCQIRIDSTDPLNVPGEIHVKGDNVFMGYYKNEDATKACFTKDGWFKTGDIGVLDEDGYLYLKGRSKCMILGPSGQNIYPEELEAVINNVRYVVDSLVVEDDGGLTALIYPDFAQGEKDGKQAAALEEEILKWLPDINSHLPAYAQIRKIEFLPEDFERTPKRSIKRYLYQRK